MKKCCFILSACLLCLSTAFAQQSALFMSLGKPLTTQKGDVSMGSQYLSDDFRKANITTTGGKKLTDLLVRYDLLNQRLEYTMDNSAYDITDSVSKFDMLGETESHPGKFTKAKSADMKAPAFLELVYTGNISLYKLNSLKIDSQEDFYTKKVTKKYVSNNTYYLQTNGSFKKIGSSKKDFLSTFKGNSRVKDVLSTADVDLNTDATIMALGEAINSK